MHTYVVCVCANVYSMYMYVYMQMSMYPSPTVDLVGGGRMPISPSSLVAFTTLHAKVRIIHG